jgi:hypothetical protein
MFQECALRSSYHQRNQRPHHDRNDKHRTNTNQLRWAHLAAAGPAPEQTVARMRRPRTRASLSMRVGVSLAPIPLARCLARRLLRRIGFKRRA